MKKIMKIVSDLITYTLMILLLMLAFFVISSKASGGEPNVLGYQLKTVLSGSMEPAFKTGSVIAVKPLDPEDKSKLKTGSVITFMESEDKLITHRIQKVVKNGSQVSYITKGDNNDGEDLNPVLPENVMAEYTGVTVPYAGYLIHYATTKAGSALILIIPGILLMIYAAYTITLAMREMDAASKTGNENSKTA